MRTHRLAIFALIALGALALAGCYDGNSTADTVAPVMISTDVTLGPTFSVMSANLDVTVPTLTFNSKAKSPTGKLSAQDDVTLTEWVTTCSRTDGGTVASPQSTKFRTVYVAAGGSATLADTSIFPHELFQQVPLVQLLPGNDGFDKETGKTNIRQQLHVEVFGKTVAGKSVSTSFDVTIEFSYQ
jgi:hypothetical protein